MSDFKWQPVRDDRVRYCSHKEPVIEWEKVEPPIEISTSFCKLAIYSKQEAEEALRIGITCEEERDKAVKFFEDLEKK